MTKNDLKKRFKDSFFITKDSKTKPNIKNMVLAVGIITLLCFMGVSILTSTSASTNDGNSTNSIECDMEIPKQFTEATAQKTTTNSFQAEIEAIKNLNQDTSSIEEEAASLSEKELEKKIEELQAENSSLQMQQNSNVSTETENTQAIQGVQQRNTTIVFDNGERNEKKLNFFDQGEKSLFGIRIGAGIQVGSIIRGVLDTGCISSGGKCPIKFTVTENVMHDNQVAIPEGAYFVGYGQADFGVKKVFITLEKLVIYNREITVKGHLVAKNNQPGFCDRYIDKTMSTLFKTSILEFAAGYMQAYKKPDYIQQGDQIITLPENQRSNAVIDGSSTSLQNFSDKVTADAARMGCVIIVNPNKQALAYMDDVITLKSLGL